MSITKERHTVTLDPETVRQAHILRRDDSLSSFVNKAIRAYALQLERRAYETVPQTREELAWVDATAATFVGDDDEDWETLLVHLP